MLRGFQISSRCASTFKKADVFKRYDFIPATKNDNTAILELCAKRFIKFEPHSKSLQLTEKQMEPFLRWIIEKSLMYPYCFKVVHKDTAKLIGVRLMSIGYRDNAKNVEPFELNESMMTGNVHVLVDIVDKAKDTFWKVVDPNINKVLRREITFIEHDHQRQGIAKALLHHNIDINNLQAEGVQGIVSEASSIANQTLLETHGYKCLYESDRKLKMDDGTPCLKVYFNDIRK